MVDCIFDGGSLWARSYFAAQKAGKDPVNVAIKTTLSMLRNTHAFGTRLDRAMICWDGERPKTKKKRLVEKPGDYIPRLEEFSKKIEEMANVVQVQLMDHEADDVVASAAEQSKADQVIVVSGDKDLSQLQCQRIAFYDLHQKIILSRRAICNRFHVHHPVQVAVALAIQGDIGDGIKGVSGWGEGKVKKLFGQIDPETPFDKVVEFLLEKMNPVQQEEFLNCLEVTLLATDLPGIPEATQITLNTALVTEFDENSSMPWESSHKACDGHTFGSKAEAESKREELGGVGTIFPCSACLRWHLEVTG